MKTKSSIIALILCLSAPVQGSESPGENSREITVLVTSGSSGRLLDEMDRTPAMLAEAVQREAEKARARGRDVLVIDAGRTLVPYVDSRWDGGEAMSWVLSAAGCQVFTPDPMDLSVFGTRMGALFASTGIEVVFPPTQESEGQGSRELPQVAVIDLGQGLEVRVLSLFDRRFEGEVAAAGLAPLAEGLPEGGDQLDIAVVHSSGTGTDLVTRGLTWSLVEKPRGLDLLLDPDLGSDLVLEGAAGDMPVGLVGRKRGSAAWLTFARVDLTVEKLNGRWQIADLDAHFLDCSSVVESESALAARIRSHFETLQAEHSQPLPSAVPTTQEGIRRFVLEAVREELRAEVVAVNEGALRRVSEVRFQGEGPTREVVERMLSLDQGLRVVTLEGSQLVELVQESVRRVRPDGSPRPDALRFIGLELELNSGGTTNATVKSLKVNGRPLMKSDPYRLATTTYLLLGGDGYPTLKGTEPEGEERPMELRGDVVFSRMERAEVPFPDLERRGLWRYGVDRLALMYNGVSTNSNPSYKDSNDSKARAEDSGSLLGEFRLRGDLDRHPVRWENRLLGSYGRQRTLTETQETDDDLRLDTSVVFVGAPVLRGKPFLAYTLDTEFVVETDASGTSLPRQLEQSLTGGLSWTRAHWPRIRIGAAYRHYGDIDRDAQLGITGEAHYRRDMEGRRPGVEVLLRAEHLTASDSSLTRFDLELRGLFPLYGSLSFSPSFNYYFLDDSAFSGDARYYRLSIGFSYDWLGKRQRW